jgi:tRNA pseudouridine38-40 synthase
VRVAFTISYDGSKFHGYAKQINTITVFNEFHSILKSVGIISKSTCAGRTDKGVHALNQVISMDIHNRWETKLNILQKIINQKLNHIQVKYIKIVANDFNPRFDAKYRIYRYIISKKPKDPFSYNYISFINEFNAKILKETTPLFTGKHNFKYFQKTGTENVGSHRTIYESKFYTYKDKGIFLFKANGFLRSQIRFMVGFLLEISNKNLTKEQLIEQLEVRKRHSCKLASANGLYLLRMKY